MSLLRLFRKGSLALCLAAGAVAFPTIDVRAQNVPTSDYVRNINGTNYAFKDYSYYDAQSSGGYFDQHARLYVPDNLNPNVSHPLVMFLHGAGENGTDNVSQVNSNIDNLLIAAQANGFLVLAPQNPTQYYGDDELSLAQNLIARTVNQYNVDPNRVYATGLSLGGGAVNTVLQEYSSQYAAYIPLSESNAVTDAQAAIAVGKPMWIFHARPDPVVTAYTSETSVRLIAADAGYPGPALLPITSTVDFQYDYGTLHFTEAGSGGHDATYWNSVYGNPALYAWMLQQKSSLKTLALGHSISMNFLASSQFDLQNKVTTDTTGKNWNTVGRQGMEATLDITVGFAKDTGGTATTTSIGLTKAFTQIGTSVPTGITAYADPNDVAEYWQITPGGTAEFKIYNLTIGAKYSLSLFASTTDANAITQYSVGSTAATLNATNNLSQFAALQNLVADSSGTLTVDIAGINSSNSGYLSTFTLTAVPEPSTMTLCVGGMMLLVWRKRRGC